MFQAIGAIVGGVTAYNQARDMGFSKSEALIAGGVGALIGTVTGGVSGTATSAGIKAAAQFAVKQSSTKVAAKLTGSMVSGGVTGATTQAISDASGDVSRGEPVSVDKGKVAVKGAEGALTGLAGGTPSALLGKSVATDAAGLAITTLIEKEKVDN